MRGGKLQCESPRDLLVGEPVVPEDPPFFSQRMGLAFLFGMVFMGLARAFIAEGKVGNTDPSRWSIGHFGSYVNGINSVWIVAPGLVALGTSPQQLGMLSTRIRVLRQAIIVLGACATCSSLLAWRQWNPMTGGVDQVLATCLVFCIYVLGVMRGGWVTMATLGFSLCTAISVMVEESFEEYQPFPHAIFRICGVMAAQAALNGGLRIPSLASLMQVSLPMIVLWLGHIQLEWLQERCWEKQYCTYLFEPLPYLRGVARNCLAVACFAGVAFYVLSRTPTDTKAQLLPEEDAPWDEESSLPHNFLEVSQTKVET